MFTASMKSTMMAAFLALSSSSCSAALRGAERNLNQFNPNIQYANPALGPRINCDQELAMEITCRDCDFDANTARTGVDQTEATLDVKVRTLTNKSWQLKRSTISTNFPVFEDMRVMGTARNAAPSTPIHNSWSQEISTVEDPKRITVLATATLEDQDSGFECVISQVFDSLVAPFNTVVAAPSHNGMVGGPSDMNP
ncbi:expressed unknown protein [Seminavis robusta]|uniref:Uncharacterized protein n=1 Tax=Seminavis robusta TaxID=568900 RepID=A0A9N8E3M9_9STRA|nr:expressed unknown protein [Seminavis robusta]|eukprot:Sro584_g170840.1 n/a (197) ;mRNA; f:41906-42496